MGREVFAHENKLPRAPPSSTISYRESIGFANDALYVLRYVRICARSVGDLDEEEKAVGASRLFPY